MAMAQVAGEYRHLTAQVITYLLAGIGYALACVVISLAVALPWLAAKGIHASASGNGNGNGTGCGRHRRRVLRRDRSRAARGAAHQLAAVTAMLLYLYVLEPLVSHIASLASWTPYLPGVAADGLTQAVQSGVRLLSPWAGGLVFAAWAAAFAITGAVVTARTDIT